MGIHVLKAALSEFPAPLRAVSLAGFALVIGLAVAVNLYLAGRSIGLILGGAAAVDWDQFVEASRRLDGGPLYAITDTYAYRYSPLLAGLFGPLSLAGTFGWRLLHFAAALALPSWPMRLLGMLSWPFWYDVQTGNLMIFIVLAAAWAIQGNRLATGIFLALALLIPRPLMLPVLAWLLWRRPGWRLAFALAAAAQAGIVFAGGWAGEWIATLAAAASDAGLPSNVAPSRFIGAWWLLAAVPLAVWLTQRGRLGLASVIASPYWLPYYLLIAILELVRPAAAVQRA